MSNNIIYQQLEEKYLPSAIDCLIETETQYGILVEGFEVDYQQIQEDYPNIYKTTIIAVDLQKQNYVCGIHLAVDFCEYIKNLKSPSKIEQINLQKQLALKALKPLIAQEYQPGEIIMGTEFGIRKEYKNQNIGYNIHYYNIQNDVQLGYNYCAEIVRNPLIVHITLKLGGNVISRMEIDQVNQIPEKYKKNIKINDVYVIGYQLNQNVLPIKLPPILETPKL